MPKTLSAAACAALLAFGPSSGAIAQGCFLSNGRIQVVSATADKSAEPKQTEIAPTQPLHAVWGMLADGRVVATPAQVSPPDPDGLEGNSNNAAAPLIAIAQDGASETLLTTDVLRAFVSPAGDAIAAITPGRNLLIWRPSGLLPLSAPGRVSHVAWSPDGARVAAAIYPPDYSPRAMDNPGTAERFIALQNSDIYLVDAATGAILSQLTTSPGTDYNPFFSPDGTTLYYTWLHETEKVGGLMQLALDKDDATSATAAAVQITQAGKGGGKVPVGRVGTYLFSDNALVFEAGRPDGSGEIWVMKPDGKTAAFVTDGRKPQRLKDGSVCVLAPDGKPRRLADKEIAR